MKGVELRRVDEDYRIHQLAFLAYAVRSTKGRKNPKPAYSTFEKFYDYEKEQKAVLEGKPQATGPDRFAALKTHLREEGKTNA